MPVTAPIRIPLARPVIGEPEVRAVMEVLRSGSLSLGPKLVQFEQSFVDYLTSPDRIALQASAVSSGTAGLHLALRAAEVKAGAEVITSPFSFVASANTILYEHARPVFVDIDPITFNIDPEAVRSAVTERTEALLPVHIFGYPADIPALEQLNLPIVEDACEALGACHSDGTMVGARGHLAVFAFYANKQLTTGEGGMVLSTNLAHKQRIDSERNQGRSSDMAWLDHDKLGYNYRLSDLACALGIAQLERLTEMLAKRSLAADRYREALAPLVENYGLELPCVDFGGNKRSWFVFVVQLPRGSDRTGVIDYLSSVGIQSKPYLPAIHLMSFYREQHGYREGQFPVCEDVAARSLALPFFPAISEGEIARVAQQLEFALTSCVSPIVGTKIKTAL